MLAEQIETAFGAPVIEAFGMTEGAHQIASNPLPPRTRKAGSVGLPTGTEVRIVDQTGHHCPLGTRASSSSADRPS